jgi:hypothetical protein
MFRRIIDSFKRKGPIQPSLGRWNTVDNADVKSALATLDSCGDSLCGDGRTSKQLIDRYTKRPTVVVLVDKNKSESKSK